ncbi:hypothetical protein GCM10007049_33290 [Echinicola pacifica]|uniref:DUF1593 domain-containing protein n=1 Tax=Echinicola pacifica TaxID=346377 RepID=A0A918QB22_9BACT|nr:DUF1593 domain-containing protein [Echinicola pacifica]GGZ37426.1 hypothetical protein GCM10007049_33290 [Echinicola pacifica]
MKFKLILTLVLIAGLNVFAIAQPGSHQDTATLKPRLVILTDVSTWETDDSESLVRLMVHADLYEIEGLVYTTGWSLEETREDFFDLIHDAIDAYEKDLPNLLKRSGQSGFLEDETVQPIGYWPSPAYLRSRTMFGSKTRGMKFVGEGNSSPGSDLIIAQADEEDPRPLWITVWGGGNTLAQAIWEVRQERSDAELRDFLHKIPTYAITDQDRDYKEGTPFETSAQQWLRKEFSEDLMYLWDECAWKYQNGTGKKYWEEYEKHIQPKGHLGKVYPKYKYGVEGDTPAFLYLMPNGLNDPMIPGQVSWGGYFEFGTGPDRVSEAYTNASGRPHEICNKYEAYFYEATFNNFVARMDWAANGTGNRNPIAIVNGHKGIDLIEESAKSGESLILDGSASSDPDGDQLHYKWWQLPEAGTYAGQVEIENSTSPKANIHLPKASQGKSIHIICEISDAGSPSLSSYRRLIISSE